MFFAELQTLSLKRIQRIQGKTKDEEGNPSFPESSFHGVSQIGDLNGPNKGGIFHSILRVSLLLQSCIPSYIATKPYDSNKIYNVKDNTTEAKN